MHILRGHHGRDRMVVGFLITCTISAYHHEHFEFKSCSGEVYSIQHYVIKFVCDSWQGGGFFPGIPVSSTNKTDGHDITEILLKVVLNIISLKLNLKQINKVGIMHPFQLCRRYMY